MKKVSIIVLCAVVMGAFEPGIRAAAPQKTTIADRLKSEYGKFKTALRCLRKYGWKTCTPAQKKRIIATGVALTALIVAVAGGSFVGWKVIQKKKEEGKQGEEKSEKSIGRLRLFSVSSKGDVNEMRELLDQGANVNSRDWKGRTLLYDAIDGNNREMVELLLDRGVKIDTSMIEIRLSPLYYALYKDKPEIVKLLIARGANVNKVGDYGTTLLYEAIAEGDQELMTVLLDHGATVYESDIQKARSPLKELLIQKMLELEKSPESGSYKPDYTTYGRAFD